MQNKPAVLYRYTYESRVRKAKSFLAPDEITVHVYAMEFPVLRHTTCGCWIKDESARERFVLFDSRKAYAYPTKDLALRSYKQRKIHHLAHLRNTLTRVEIALEQVLKAECKPEALPLFNDGVFLL